MGQAVNKPFLNTFHGAVWLIPPPPTQKKCESLFVIAKIQLGYVKMEKPCEYNGLNRLNASCGSTRYAKHKSVSEGN